MHRNRAFTLVELLVVVGIIGLLIGILLPSLSGARKSAKNGKIKLQFNSLSQALEMFRNDVGEYPDSSKRPDPTDLSSGPGVVHAGNDSTLYGAQMLVRGLWGKDSRGYVQPSRARKHDSLAAATEWYDHPETGYTSDFPRESAYMVERMSVVPTNQITAGVKPQVVTADPDKYENPVLLDAYERPILYYRANPRGRAANKVMCTNEIDGQGFPVYNASAIPYYNQLDNDLFTGNYDDNMFRGWKFSANDHPLAFLGDCVDEPDDVSSNVDAVNTNMTFAKYIHDHNVGLNADGGPDDQHGVILPFNPDSYLLFSAGADGIFGTGDDVKNFDAR